MTAPDAPRQVSELLPPEAAAAVAAAARSLDRLEECWPPGVELVFSAGDSIYHGYPYLFLEAFPNLAIPGVEPLASACQLLFDSLFVADGLMDGERVGERLTADTVQLQAMQLESYRLFHGLFAPHAVFWERFHGYFAAYAAACLEERRLAGPGASWDGFGEAEALRMAADKCGLARVAVAGLSELAGDEAPLPTLERAIERYYVARQMVDDLSDWRIDRERGFPSLLLARVVADAFGGDRQALADDEERTRQAIYLGGHGADVLELALAALDESDRLTAAFPDLPFRRLTARLRGHCETAVGQLRASAAGSTSRRRVELRLPPPDGPFEETAWEALRTLLARRTPSGGRAPAGGDLLERTLVAEALSDADGLLEGQLGPLLEREADVLLNRRLRSGFGGWGFSGAAPHLPPSAHHLALVLRFLLRIGRRAEAEACCEEPLTVLLQGSAAAAGAIAPWIVAPGTAPPDEEPDEAVTAELLHALALYDAPRFEALIDRRVEWLEARQEPGGAWRSAGLFGRFYPTAACLGLLTAVRPGSPAVGGAAEWLRRQQRDDGGFGGVDDALSTALGVLGLALLPETAARPEDRSRALRALPRLAPRPGAASGSRRLTAAFTLRAAAAWARSGREAATPQPAPVAEVVS